mgnify:CR=1 FL=1
MVENLSEYVANKEPKELDTITDFTDLLEESKRIDKKVPNYRGVDDEELRKVEWPFDSLF